MTIFSTSDAQPASADRYSVDTPLDWKRASKASICAFMLAFAPLSGAMAQSSGDDGYIAPAAPAAPADDSSDDDVAAPAPAAPAAAAPAAAAPASAAPAAAVPAAAVPSASPTVQLGDVSVTGTAISRPSAATAAPVTSYDTQELRKQGITSTQQFMQQVTGNNTDSAMSVGTGAQVTGGSSFANLRGLGANKTLVLLNGRRLAVNALDGGATDLSNIPFSAIDHVEILRDGASALYGTDAVGGVINFITKKNLDGGNVNLEYTLPTRSGGGNKRNVSVTFGKGDFDKDGWNIMGTASYKRTDAISANDRDFITPLDPRIAAVSAFTYPSQYIQDSTGVFANPAAPGCNAAPGQLPDAVAGGDGSTCRENYTRLGAQVQQKNDKASFYGLGSYKLNDHNKMSLSYLWSRQVTTSVSAPAPGSGFMEIQPGTPFYPGQGNVPLPSADQGGASFDPTKPITLYYRGVPLGPRVSEGINEYHRAVLDFTGDVAGFRYDTALSYNQGTTDINLVGGNYNNTVGPNSLQALINNGQYNPFTANPTSGQLAALNSTETRGNIEADKTRAYIWDGKVQHDVGNWFGSGQSILALGAQYRHETLTSTIDGSIAELAPSSGQAASKVDEDRDVEGVFGELNIPILDTLELDAQARYDNYSDVGDTLNPKVSLRYQPIDQLTLRASYGEGFHAPTLYDLYQPQVDTYTGAKLDDPVLCTGGQVQPGGVQNRDCNNQFKQTIGGNPDLKPEKSKNWSLGFVVQPHKYVSFSADFWAVELSQQIGTLDPTFVFNHFNEYRGNFERDQQTQEILRFQNTNFNLGKTETNGEDIQLNVAVPTNSGTYSLSMKGTYINKYSYQTAKNTDYIKNVSSYRNGNIFRWQHNITLGWSKGPMALGVVNHYYTGYTDYRSDRGTPINDHKVSDYVTWDTYGSYSFDNGLQITLGSNNVFDVDPPFTVQPDVGNSGYDTRYADPVGRTVYGRLTYKF